MPIFDQGYQHWKGRLWGHGWRWFAIAYNGVRTNLKPWRTRLLLFSAGIPALGLAGILAMWGLLERGSSVTRMFMQYLVMMNPAIAADPKHYRVEIWTLAYHYFLSIELYFSMILVLLIGPSLISQDLRFNALPLYFSRPLRRIDYFLGKLGVIIAFMVMVVIAPALAAYVLGLAFSLDINIIRDTYRLLLGVVAYGAVLSISAGVLILALSALSRNSRYVTLMFVGFWLVSGITSDILVQTSAQERRQVYFTQIAVQENLPMTPPPFDASAEDRRRWRTARRQSFTEYQATELDASRTDWRPVVSYVGDLWRIERELTGSDEAWRQFSLLQPESARASFLYFVLGPQFPWEWSAAVLAGLLGISAWILYFPIRSLDRLR